MVFFDCNGHGHSHQADILCKWYVIRGGQPVRWFIEIHLSFLRGGGCMDFDSEITESVYRQTSVLGHEYLNIEYRENEYGHSRGMLTAKHVFAMVFGYNISESISPIYRHLQKWNGDDIRIVLWKRCCRRRRMQHRPLRHFLQHSRNHRHRFYDSRTNHHHHCYHHYSCACRDNAVYHDN